MKAQNIGYRDGRYELKFNSRRVQLSAQFDQTPLNYSYDTRTPYDCTAGNCSLDPSLRAQVQAKTAVGIPQNAGQLSGGSVYNSIANPFDLQSRRDTIAAQLRISATDNLDFTLGVNSYKRSGNMPYGASFAFNVATELPIVIDNRETDLSVGVEWASHQGMFRFGYEHSKFDQNDPVLHVRQPADGDRLLQDRHHGPGAGRLLRPERVHQRQRAGLRAHGAAAVEHHGHVQLGGHGQAARPHDGERQLHDGGEPPGRGAHPVDDQPEHRQRDGVRDVPGAGRAAPRHGRHEGELHDRHHERELAAAQVA